jgi:hypothetical protein
MCGLCKDVLPGKPDKFPSHVRKCPLRNEELKSAYFQLIGSSIYRETDNSTPDASISVVDSAIGRGAGIGPVSTPAYQLKRKVVDCGCSLKGIPFITLTYA